MAGEVVIGRFRAFQSGRISGAEANALMWNAYLARDGRIARYREHLAEDDALRTASEFAATKTKHT